MSSSSTQSSNLTPRYSCIQFFFWMDFVILANFASVFLLNTGFTNTQIGIVIAMAGVVSAILQPTVASYADKNTSPSLKKICIFIALIALALSAFLLFYTGSLLCTGIFYGSCFVLMQLLTPMINSLGMETLNQGKKLNFGIARGMGSLSAAVIASTLGILVDRFGAKAIPVSLSIGLLFFLFFLWIFPFRKIPKEHQQNLEAAEKAPGSGALYFFRKYKKFTIVLLGSILVYVSHVLINSFAYQVIEAKGGTSTDMGIAMAIAAVMELPTMFLFGYMQKKIRCDIWFRICGIFFALKTLFSLLAPNMTVFYIIQVFQIFAWALISVSSVYYVNSIMEPQDVIKGQAYFTMTYTIGTVLGALLGGWLIDLAGVSAMLIFGTVAASIGALLMLFATENPEKATSR
nr:MFS transporter [uncultured Blautia sp.]